MIALARLYHVSLDELLKIHEQENEDVCAPDKDKETQSGIEAGFEPGSDGPKEKTEDYFDYTDGVIDDVEENVHVGFDGIHVKDKDGEVHVSWSGIHVHDKKKDNEVHIDKNGIRVNGEDAEGHIFSRGNGAQFPLGIIAIVVYIIIGAVFNAWHPGWLIFFLVPIIGSFIHAVRQKNPNLFAYPVLVVLVFLYVGLVYYVWHPTWVVFLTIPVYYSITGYIVRTFTKDVDESES